MGVTVVGNMDGSCEGGTVGRTEGNPVGFGDGSEVVGDRVVVSEVGVNVRAVGELVGASETTGLSEGSLV